VDGFEERVRRGEANPGCPLAQATPPLGASAAVVAAMSADLRVGRSPLAIFQPFQLRF